MGVSGGFQGSSWAFPGSLKSISQKFQGSVIEILKVFQKSTEAF